MTHDILLIAVMALVTAAIRFLPFVLFSSSRKPPEMVERLTRLLPAAVMGMLIVYCLRNTDLLHGSHGVPEAAACAVVVASYIWRRNTLLSILTGTVLYMALLQLVF